MPVETWDTRSLTPTQAQAIGEIIARVWPKPNVTAEDRAAQQLAIGRESHGPAAQAPRSFVVRDGGRVVAHAGLLPRRVVTEAGDIMIGGLTRVCTDPDARGRGLGELVVRAAFAVVDSGDFAFSLFQTNEKVQPFYERFGAVVVDNRFVNSLADNPEANPFCDKVVMRYPGGRGWPAGTIDLTGPGY